MSQSPIATKFDVTTLLGSKLSLETLLPVQVELKHEFTLNNYYQVFPDTDVQTAPVLKYFGVGIKGCYNSDAGILSSAYRPKRTNMNLYEPIPIRCRPVDEDLTDAERAQYRMRVRKTIDGNDYYCYYLKLLDLGNEVKFKKINPLTGKEEPYELNSQDLNPKPEKQGSDVVITTDVSQVVAYAEAHVHLEASEVLEYIQAYYHDVRYARISEIGLFTGEDRLVEGVTDQSTRIQYNESLYTMLYNHLTNLGYDLSDNGSSIDSIFEISSRGAILSEQ